ncbi:hypothetical protein GGR51DRAFT_315612 [Nemania sp. FL0031]|nr:hypothetical protein GGR51DRAFT_315612 [Nemania sp. FL0031]
MRMWVCQLVATTLICLRCHGSPDRELSSFCCSSLQTPVSLLFGPWLLGWRVQYCPVLYRAVPARWVVMKSGGVGDSGVSEQGCGIKRILNTQWGRQSDR